MNQYLSEALSKTNYKKGRGEQKPLILVIHRISLPGLTAGSAISRFTDPKQEVSSHAICKYDGTIINLVRDSDTAFCNGVVVNPKSSLVKMYFQKGISINEISLSLENEGSEYADLTSEQYKANASWVKEKCIKFNIPINALHVIRHDQIRSDKTCPGKINIEKIIILASKAEPIQPDIPTSMIPATNLTPIDDRITLLSRLLELYRQLLEVLLNRDKLGNARSPGWPAFRKLHIKKNCSGCGKKGTLLKSLELHHLRPVHLFPDDELNPENVETVCRRCHQLICHLDSFFSYNKDAKEDLTKLLEAIKNRP